MVLEEYGSVHKSKFPESGFTAELLEMGIKTINKEDAIVFTFKGEEEPMEVAWRGIDKALIVDPKTKEKKLNDFFSAGAILANLRGGYVDKNKKQHPGHGLKVLIDRENKTMATEPSILHKILRMETVNERVVTGEDGNRTYRDFVIEEIKGTPQTITAPETPKSSGLTPEQIQSLRTKWEAFVLESVTQPITKSDFWKLLKTKEPDMKPSQAWEVLEALKDTLKVGEGGKYSVV